MFAELFLDDASAAKTDTRAAATPPAASRAADELRLVEGLLGTMVNPLLRTATSDGTMRELHRALRDRSDLPAKKAALDVRVRGRWKLPRKEGKEAMTATFLGERTEKEKRKKALSIFFYKFRIFCSFRPQTPP